MLYFILVPGDNYGDSSDKLRKMFLDEAERVDKEITENWKAEADRILVFVSVHSPVICIYSI